MVKRMRNPISQKEMGFFYSHDSLACEFLQDLAELAGKIKASRKMSLADCFTAALAKQRNGEIYTGDPEFKALEPEWKIVWL